jgi:glycosyltransferase involved in cell wall biosynthesis
VIININHFNSFLILKITYIIIQSIYQLLTHLALNFDIWGEIGDVDYFNLISKSIKNLPKNINCIYKGKLALMDAKFKFSIYNLFIFPTKGENYGHVIFESLSCGCPILLSENTTPWNNLETNKVGYNISLDDKQGWIDKIIYFSTLNITDREIYAENCKNYIKNNIKYDDILQENLLLFN